MAEAFITASESRRLLIASSAGGKVWEPVVVGVGRGGGDKLTCNYLKVSFIKASTGLFCQTC